MIINGVTFIAFLTATVTSYFVSAEREETKTRDDRERRADVTQVTESLQQIEERLTEIETKLGG